MKKLYTSACYLCWTLLFFLFTFTSCEDEEAHAPAPTADFALANTTPKIGDMLAVENLSTHATAFSWSFGNGETSRAETPEIRYTSPGTYTITLIASGAGGSSRVEKQVQVAAAPPEASFTVADADALEVDIPVQFTNTSFGRAPMTYAWSFGDAENSTATDKDPSFTYSSPGTYTVSLTVSNQDGEHTFSEDITIQAPPMANKPAAFYMDTDALILGRVLFEGETAAPSTAFELPGAGFGLALDAANELVYFADEDAGAIMRAKLDGSQLTTLIADAGTPKNLVLDLENSKLYWTDNAGSTVSVANLDGSGRQDLITANPVTGAAGDFVGLAVDAANNRLYWTDVISAEDEGVYSAALDGSNAQKLVSAWSHAVQVYNGRIYYSNVNTSAIESATTTGSDIQEVGALSYRAYGIAIDGTAGKIYWTDLGDDIGLGLLKRANLDGSNEETLASTLGEPRGLILNL